MARSTYVYVVQRLVGMPVLAVFTVKHELITWMQKRPGQRGVCQILRFRDGEGYAIWTVITHDIEQEAYD